MVGSCDFPCNLAFYVDLELLIFKIKKNEKVFFNKHCILILCL